MFTSLVGDAATGSLFDVSACAHADVTVSVNINVTLAIYFDEFLVGTEQHLVDVLFSVVDTDESAVAVIIICLCVVYLDGMSAGGAEGLHVVVAGIPGLVDGPLLSVLCTDHEGTLVVALLEVNHHLAIYLWDEVHA